MGAHKRKPTVIRTAAQSPRPLPPYPNNTSKKNRNRTIEGIRGEKRHFIIEDEIRKRQSDYREKLIVLQRLNFPAEKKIEYRLGYYMIGVKPGAKGKWVWGQFCLMLPERDLKAIMRKAQKKGWF